MQSPQFFGPKGEPDFFATQGIKKPMVGEVVTGWGPNARRPMYGDLPRKLNITFDTSKLDIPDYRVMCEHPQIAASLAVLSFMMYQRDYRMVGANPKANKHCEENLRMLWPRLVRGLSTAFWAGYSPMATQFENDLPGGKTWITKIKDLAPETCLVRWKDIPGVVEKKKGVNSLATRKAKIFDGIMQPGLGPEIPVSNSFWYAFQMSEGNYYGKKLLNAAFQPWYFSLLMHLYANRYFERFAEPTMIGRAPYDSTIRVAGRDIPGNTMLRTAMSQSRSGGGVVLPNDRSTNGLNDDSTYDYTLEFLESQLRGVDYERHLLRLDEEISMAMFTPMLLMRQADTGSSNLGVVHTSTYHQMLNAISSDWEEYINHYLIRAMCDANGMGRGGKYPRIEFRPLGKLDGETMRALLQTLLASGKAKITDLTSLGQAAGLELEEVKEVLPDALTDEPQGPMNPDGTKKDPRIGRPGKNVTPKGTDKVDVKTAAEKIVARLRTQTEKAVRENTWHQGYVPDLGFRRQVIDAIGLDEWEGGEVYQRIEYCVTQLADIVSADEFPAAAQATITGVLTEVVEREVAYS